MTSPSVLSLAARNAVLERCTVLARCTALAMIGLGAFLRANAFGFPQTFLFAEHDLVLGARNYLAHEPDLVDQPLLGKLIVAASIQLFGDRPIGWRTPSLLFGALTVVAGAVAAKRLFRNRDAALLAAGLLCADGFLIAYSRTAALDGFLTACAVAALWIATLPVTWTSAVLGGVLVGTACSLGLSGVAVIAPLSLAIAFQARSAKRRASFAATLLGTAALVYAALYACGLGAARDAVAVGGGGNHTTALVDATWASSWATWALPWRPIVLGLSHVDGSVRALSTLGNLLIWWSSIALALAALWSMAARGLRTSR